MLRILLADDHEVVRQGLRLLLQRQEGWEICGEATTGREAVAMASELKPDVAVLDVAMPELNGLDATRQIRKASPRTEVLAFTMHESEALVREALAAGAKGYLLKSDAGRHVVAAVEALAAGKTYFNAKVSATIVEGFLRSGAASPSSPDQQFTSREREVMQLLAEGRSNKEVATRLAISVKTAEAHRAAIMRKLRARSLADVVRYAVRNGITPP